MRSPKILLGRMNFSSMAPVSMAKERVVTRPCNGEECAAVLRPYKDSLTLLVGLLLALALLAWPMTASAQAPAGAGGQQQPPAGDQQTPPPAPQTQQNPAAQRGQPGSQAVAGDAAPAQTAIRPQQPLSPEAVIDRIIAQEQAEVGLVRQYSPLVETYIQYVRPNKATGAAPDGDKYFLGRAELSRGVDLMPLDKDAGLKHKVLGSWSEFFTSAFMPRGFLQMIFLDMTGFDQQHYRIEYVRREFLGEVRYLVF